jgi:hypothetical protein
MSTDDIAPLLLIALPVLVWFFGSRALDRLFEELRPRPPARLGEHERLPCDGEAMRLSGEDDNGDPTSIYVEVCHSCGALVDVSTVDMVDHHLAAHPIGRVDHSA